MALVVGENTYASLAAIQDWNTARGYTGTIIEADVLRAMAVKGKWVTTRWTMYAGVRIGGWLSFKNMAGSLDYRTCKKCIRPNCDGCGNIYHNWQKCFKQGYWPDLGEL